MESNISYTNDVQEFDGFYVGMEKVKVIQYAGLSREQWYGKILRIIAAPRKPVQFEMIASTGGFTQWVIHSDLYDGNPGRYNRLHTVAGVGKLFKKFKEDLAKDGHVNVHPSFFISVVSANPDQYGNLDKKAARAFLEAHAVDEQEITDTLDMF